MKKFLKFFVTAILCVAMSLVSLVACNGGNGDGDSSTSSANVNTPGTPSAGQTLYTFTVLYPNGDPVVGVKIIYCTVEGGMETNCTPTQQKTDDNGVIYQVATTAEYHIHVQTCPEGYTDGYSVGDPHSSPASVNATTTSATITLTAIN